MQETLLNIVLIIVTDFSQFTNISNSINAARIRLVLQSSDRDNISSVKPAPLLRVITVHVVLDMYGHVITCTSRSIFHRDFLVLYLRKSSRQIYKSSHLNSGTNTTARRMTKEANSVYIAAAAVFKEPMRTTRRNSVPSVDPIEREKQRH